MDIKLLILRNILILCSAIGLGSSVLANENSFFLIGTGSVKGVYMPVSNRICQRINANSELHGYRCGVSATTGSDDNLRQLREGEVQLSFAQSDLVLSHFSAYEQNEYVSVFSLHVEPIHVVVRSDSGIDSLSGLEGKRVNVGQEGSGTLEVATSILGSVGITREDFTETNFSPSDQSFRLCSGNIDAFIWVAGKANSSVAEAFSSCDVELLSLNENTIGHLLEKQMGFEATLIPAGTYFGQDLEVKTAGPRARLLTLEGAPEEIIKLTIRALLDEFGQISQIHPSLADLDKESLLIGRPGEKWHQSALELISENNSR